MAGYTPEQAKTDEKAGQAVLSRIAKMSPEELAKSPAAMAVLTKIGELAEQNPALAELEGNRGPDSRSHNFNLAGGLNDTQKLALDVLKHPDLMKQVAAIDVEGKPGLHGEQVMLGLPAVIQDIGRGYRVDGTGISAQHSAFGVILPGGNAQNQDLSGNPDLRVGIPGGPENYGRPRIEPNPVDDSPPKLSGADLQRLIDQRTSGGVTLIGGQGNPLGPPKFEPGMSYAMDDKGAKDKPPVTVKGPGLN